jgi:hypothetical protein
VAGGNKLDGVDVELLQKGAHRGDVTHVTLVHQHFTHILAGVGAVIAHLVAAHHPFAKVELGWAFELDDVTVAGDVTHGGPPNQGWSGRAGLPRNLGLVIVEKTPGQGRIGTLGHFHRTSQAGSSAMSASRPIGRRSTTDPPHGDLVVAQGQQRRHLQPLGHHQAHLLVGVAAMRGSSGKGRRWATSLRTK